MQRDASRRGAEIAQKELFGVGNSALSAPLRECYPLLEHFACQPRRD